MQCECELIANLLLKNNWFLCTAESCTGGLIAAACTDLAGSSAWFERGFVTYANAAKTEMLGVDAALIDTHGAVSEPVARAMATGALRHSRAQVSVATTGVAGPGGGSVTKPVGTVGFGFAFDTSSGSGSDVSVTTELHHFPGDRAAVRRAAVHLALTRLAELIQTKSAR